MFVTLGTASSYKQGFAQVQSKTYASTADNTNHSIVLDSAPTQNNLIVVFIAHDGTLNTPPSGYSLAESGVDFIWGRCYYKVAGASESATISIVLAGNEPVAMIAYEYSGMATSLPEDQSVAATGVGTGTTIVSGTTPATTNANDLVFVSFHMRKDVGAQTVTAYTNSFVEEDEVSTTGATNVNLLLAVAAKEVSATGTQQSTGSITTGGLGHDVALVVAFKKA